MNRLYYFSKKTYLVQVSDNVIKFDQKPNAFSSNGNDYKPECHREIIIKDIMQVMYIKGKLGMYQILLYTQRGEVILPIVVHLKENEEALFNILINDITEKVKNNPKEIKKKCRVCGKIFCYSGYEMLENRKIIEQNQENSAMAGLATIGSLASGVTGNKYDMYEQSKIANNAHNESKKEIKDFNKCPNCGSRDLEDITNIEEKDEIIEEKKDSQIKKDNELDKFEEIKKYKELLDIGAITQEEFDKKKKKLLEID